MRWFLVALFACLLGVGVARADESADPHRQILVMLRLPPAHFRPDGGYSGGYADPAGSTARRLVAMQLAREHGLAMATDWPMPLLGVDCYVMNVPLGRAAPAVADLLSRDARVSWAQAMNVYHAMANDDPLNRMQAGARGWQLAELHAVATGRGVRIAIVDSGVETRHPDLAGQVVVNENFVTGRLEAAEAHGTAVAGIIAARADNGVGIAGVAPGSRLMALRACWQEADGATLCTSLSLALALQAAVARDAQIINLSLSGPNDRLLDRILDVALARGITVVAAADRAAPGGGFPAAHAGVVSVADAAPGPLPAGAVIAPGRDIATTAPGARWAVVSGASYAAAHVSGLFALLRELHGRAPASAAAAELVLQADGQVDACASLGGKVGPCACACTAAQSSRSTRRE